MLLADTADLWGTAIPTWLAAIGGIAAAVVALIAYLSSIRNRKGLNTLREGVSDDQSAEPGEPGDGGPRADDSSPRPGEPNSDSSERLVTRHPRWRVQERGRGRYGLANESNYALTLLAFRDVTPDGDNAAQLLMDLPLLMGPGVSLPFRIDKTLVSPAVTAIELHWTPQSDGTSTYYTTIYV